VPRIFLRGAANFPRHEAGDCGHRDNQSPENVLDGQSRGGVKNRGTFGIAKINGRSRGGAGSVFTTKGRDGSVGHAVITWRPEAGGENPLQVTIAAGTI